jgi:chromosome segregation ATPase
MEWLWGVLIKVLGIGGKGAKDAIVGYDRLASRLEKRLDNAERRLDECDDDRQELRGKVSVLEDRVEECDEHRSRLQSEVTSIKTKVTNIEQKTP